MNLIEFPFATLSERSGNRNVLEYQLESYDRVLGKPVLRKLTVTGDAKFGLPTAKDEEVYLGLLQLTKLHNDFQEPQVDFTRSELIKLMGWKNRDWSYHRIATALNRLTGVRLFYENAWRDNTQKRFISRGGFGLLDSFELRDGRIRGRCGEDSQRWSEFRWSSVVFDSFQAGYLKKLDYGRVRELSASARRMYRFLDKHFYPPHHTTLTFNLKTFAQEHIGLSRKYDNAQIRRSLTKAIGELEAIGFLAPDKRRFRRGLGKRSEWEIVVTLVGHPARRGRRSRSGCANLTSAAPGQLTPQVVRDDSVERYLLSLGPAQLRVIEDEAIQGASGFFREQLAGDSLRGPLADECRRQIVHAFVRNRIGKGTAS